jgi:cytochrome P450
MRNFSPMLALSWTGHETKGLAFTWTWHVLAQHPEAEKRSGPRSPTCSGTRALIGLKHVGL